MTNTEPDHDAGQEEQSESEGMTFLEHLEEFRWTVGRSLLAFIVGAVLVGVFLGDIAQFLQYPLNVAYGSSELAGQQLITKNPMGVLSVVIQVIFLGGLTLSLPFILYFLGMFVAPGLNEDERKVLMPSAVAAFVLFVTGVAFSFFAVLPLTLAFCVRLNDFFNFTLLWDASDYFNMVVWFSVALGGFFQFPLITVILVVIGVFTTEQLKACRRFVVVGILVFAALLTPGGDPFSLAIMSIPMYALYELAIWIGGRIERRKREAALAELDDL
ncbi:MAG: twin-arginine translocase subunit TatC [Opitutales bacterium]